MVIDTGKPRKTCVEVTGRRNFRILTSSQQFGKKMVAIVAERKIILKGV